MRSTTERWEQLMLSLRALWTAREEERAISQITRRSSWNGEFCTAASFYKVHIRQGAGSGKREARLSLNEPPLSQVFLLTTSGCLKTGELFFSTATIQLGFKFAQGSWKINGSITSPSLMTTALGPSEKPWEYSEAFRIRLKLINILIL